MFLRIWVAISLVVAGCGSSDHEAVSPAPANEGAVSNTPAEVILSELETLVKTACACSDTACREKVVVSLEEWSVRHGPSQERFSDDQRGLARTKASKLTRCVVPAEP